jgi:isopenicillin N synthase-like dioxygenase
MKKILLTMTLILTTATASASDFDSTIPVLDMQEYFHPETKPKFLGELHQALSEVGFFAVVNTGVDPQVLTTGYQSCFDFFALSHEEKMQANVPSFNGQRGYVPGETAKGGSKGDFKEFYHVGRERSKEEVEQSGSMPNVWSQAVDLKNPLCTLFSALEECMVPIQVATAEALGVDTDLFTNMTKEGELLLRAIHYPASPPQDRFWAAEHTDIDLFTILPCATAEGLQVQNKQGEWIDIKVPPNAFIINAGDMLENITNGEFRSGLHRVVAKEDGYERYSMVLFIHPRSPDRLDPLPDCIARTGGIRKYANANRLELLEERLVDLGLASFPMMQDLAESGLMERLIEVGRASPGAMLKLQKAGLASDAILQELGRLGISN